MTGFYMRTTLALNGLNLLIMCKEGWCVGLGWGTCLKYLKRGWNRKVGRRNKYFKRGDKLGQGVGALKVEGLEPPYKLWYCFDNVSKLLLYLYLTLFNIFAHVNFTFFFRQNFSTKIRNFTFFSNSPRNLSFNFEF